MSQSFPGKTSDIPLPPQNASQIFAANAAARYAAPQTSSNYVDPQTAAYYAYQQYAAGAQAAAAAAYQFYGYPVIPQAYAGAPQYALTPQMAAVHSAAANAHAAQNAMNGNSNDSESADDDPTVDAGQKASKLSNTLPIWGNEKTMNLNPLVLTNIQNSPYFKTKLYTLKTYHEVIDEIWYQVKHLEPWEKGSRRVSGQTGMCGSVRGVGAGGIVSTPYCILYKLYTLRLTRKQVIGLLKHKDSPFIRAIGFMYIRYTQPPEHLWSWYEAYLDDDEELDVKAGGGQRMTIGQLVKHLLTKLDWFSTLFPRIPVPIQKDIEKKMNGYEARKKEEEAEYYDETEAEAETTAPSNERHRDTTRDRSGERRKRSRSGDRRTKRRSRSRSPDRRHYQSSDRRRHH
ncbi:pre-mRNA-splicing factor 38B-like isoform X1 [Leptotrombidium deliense]|uniref:Pre-mRNA-splicing factor 38 n=1 Tax=Leptotrombidium deliense TaxID=299467 RepID=A0A443S7I6_9ACAR|nr:pre-mRNA-splicing factor 38B-like isoform X1 [Leptotrombidium deliense]